MHMFVPAAVAPPPPAVVPLPGGEDILPPARAALKPIVGAASSSNCPFPHVELSPFSVVAEGPAPAGDDDNEDISVVAELSNPVVAAELAEYLKELIKPRKCVGIAAFVLFALVFRKRVRLWYRDVCEDIVERYAPWAVDYITEWATVQGVACKVHDGALRMCDPSLHDMNHWVAAWPCDEAWGFDADAFKDAEDEGLFRHYHCHGLRIERTECCDDCGPDTMSLMLGEERSLENRTEIRRKLVQFVKATEGTEH